jgi:hypothetical protein
MSAWKTTIQESEPWLVSFVGFRTLAYSNLLGTKRLCCCCCSSIPWNMNLQNTLVPVTFTQSHFHQKAISLVRASKLHVTILLNYKHKLESNNGFTWPKSASDTPLRRWLPPLPLCGVPTSTSLTSILTPKACSHRITPPCTRELPFSFLLGSLDCWPL